MPFLGLGECSKTVLRSPYKTNNFCFQSIVLFWLYHVVLSSCGRWWVGGWWWFPAITLCQLNYSYGCFVVGVVVVVGL